MEIYQKAYYFYIENCQRHGIERIIEFKQFMNWLTKEQAEQMLHEAH